jgi:hypothetical protein
MKAFLQFLSNAAQLGMILVAFGGFAYAWIAWRSKARETRLSTWRRTVFYVGFLAVAKQACLLIASWTRFARGDLFYQWCRWVLPSFLIALPCVLAGKGAARWWLLASSVLQFVISSFIVLSV